jgi:hypothetical protein
MPLYRYELASIDAASSDMTGAIAAGEDATAAYKSANFGGTAFWDGVDFYSSLDSVEGNIRSQNNAHLELGTRKDAFVFGGNEAANSVSEVSKMLTRFSV